MGKAFDVIVVGARCAGSPTAMLLARRGLPGAGGGPCVVPERHRLDPHLVHPRAVNGAIAMGAARPAGGDRMPADPYLHLRLRRVHHCGRPRHGQGSCRLLPAADHPRQTAGRRRAAESGAEIRQGFAVEEIIVEGERVVGIKGRSKQGGAVTEYADVVVGADGRHSMLSEGVHPEHYREKPPLLAGYYSYWSGLPTDGRFETYIRDSAHLRPCRPMTT